MLVVIRIILGFLFIVSGMEKVISPAANFQYVIEGYAIFPPVLAHAASVVFPWMELFTGLFIMLGLWLSQSLVSLLLMTTTFIVIVGQAIIRKLPLENCGCFGNLIHLPLQGVIMLDSVIFALTVLLLLNTTEASKFGLDAFYDRSVGSAKIRKGQKL